MTTRVHVLIASPCPPSSGPTVTLPLVAGVAEKPETGSAQRERIALALREGEQMPIADDAVRAGEVRPEAAIAPREREPAQAVVA